MDFLFKKGGHLNFSAHDSEFIYLAALKPHKGKYLVVIRIELYVFHWLSSLIFFNKTYESFSNLQAGVGNLL